ncbi:Lipoprotein NlpD [Candidatus Burkholderia humilis]|nr:Lipoprotein NlpD [Candidatus Burkholderia humilis]
MKKYAASLKSFRSLNAAFLICILSSGCAFNAHKESLQAPEKSSFDSATLSPGYYRVAQGDTLASIAAAYGHDARRNGISPDAPLIAGELLHIGPPVTPQSGAAPAAPLAPQASKPACSADSLIWPVKGPVLSRFGANDVKAITIGGQVGDTIGAAASGRVVYVGDKIKGYGLLVIVRHRNGFLSAYGQNQRVLIREGNDVKQGQPIALMGGPSLEKGSVLFEVRKDRQPVDPLGYLADCGS